jgi:uncharacterized DUF497 family protein
MVDFSNVTGFEWEGGNETRNHKHGVLCGQAEEIFSNTPLWIIDDLVHSLTEDRSRAIGRTHEGLVLVVAFTLRENGTKIRVISARIASRKERMDYEKF